MSVWVKMAAIALGLVGLLAPMAAPLADSKPPAHWVTGYLMGEWHREDGTVGILTDTDWQTLTHVIHFAAGLNNDGSLDLNFSGWGLSDQNKRSKLIGQAHAHGVYILFSVVSFGGYQAVLDDPKKRRTLVEQLVAVLQNGDGPGYDGLDIDFEPITADASGNNPGYEAFINELHAKLQAINQENNPGMLARRPLLTVATGPEVTTDEGEGTLRKLLAKLQDKFDQVNLMAYDLSTIHGDVTWHDGALFDGGKKYPTNPARSVISVHRTLRQFIGAGVKPGKLGLGISAEIRVWRGGRVADAKNQGVNAPFQRWSLPPASWDSDPAVNRASYAQLMQPGFRCVAGMPIDCSYRPERYRWDDAAKVPYLSIDNPNPDDDIFISYNDARAVREKVRYVKEHGLGGVMLWELGRECVSPQIGGSKDRCQPGGGEYRPLLNAIRKAMRR